MNQKMLAVACMIAVSGCGNAFTRQPETADDALRELERNLAGASYLSESDLLAEETSRQFQNAKQFVNERQCASRTGNPMVLVPLPLTLSLRGTIDGRGSVRILGPVQPAGQAGSGTFEVPLRVSTVANLPSEYLRDMSALAGSSGLPGDVAEKLRRELGANYEMLSARVRALVNAYDPRRCGIRHVRSVLNPSVANFVPPTF